MEITIDIQETELTFDELKQALTQSLEENGVDSSPDNIEIVQADGPEPDLDDVTQNPTMPPGGQGKQLRSPPRSTPGGPTAGAPPSPNALTSRPKSQ